MGGLAALALAGMLAAAPQVSVPFTTLHREAGTLTDYKHERAIVIRTQDHYRRVWRRLDTGKDRPPVDFARATVVVLVQGPVPDGSRVRVRGVRRTARGLTVRATQVFGDGCAAGGGNVTPYHAISIPRTEEPIAVERKRIDHSCE